MQALGEEALAETMVEWERKWRWVFLFNPLL